MIRAFAVIALLLWGGGSAHAQVMATGAGPGSAFTGCVPILAAPTTDNLASGAASAASTVDVPAGSTVVVFVNIWSSTSTGQSILTVADSVGNNYTLAQPLATGSTVNAAIAYNTNVLHIPKGTTFTATTSGSPAVNWGMKGAYISCTTGAPDQVVAFNQTTAGTTNVTLNSGTLASTTETAFAYSYNPTGVTITRDPNFTDLLNNANNDLAYRNLISQASVSYHPTFSVATTSSNILLTFQQAGCAQYTALAARLTITASTNTGAIQALICGMANDATYQALDGLYVFATDSTTNANLNWAQNAFNLTTTGTVNFAANVGYTSNGSTGFLSTGFNPSTAGGHFALTSASLGVCDVSSRTVSNSNFWEIGSFDGTNVAGISLLGATGNQIWYVNSTLSGGAEQTPGTNVQGSWAAVRTVSGDTLYLNGSGSAGVKSSSALPNTNLGILTLNNSTSNITPDQIAYAFYGAGLTGTQVNAIVNRLRTYLIAVGSTAVCGVGPSVTAGATVSYGALNPPVTLDSALAISDPGIFNLSSAAVTVSGGPALPNGDTLSFTSQPGIIGNYNSSTGVLTLSGNASIASYRAALQSVKYNSTASDPTNGGANPSRTITWVVTE